MHFTGQRRRRARRHTLRQYPHLLLSAPPSAPLQARHNLAQHLRSTPEYTLNRRTVVHENRRSIQTASFRIMDFTARRLLAYAYGFRGILPLQPVPDHVDDPADHPPVINPWHTMR